MMTDNTRRKMRKNISGWIFVLPALFLIILFNFKPIVENVYLSFQNWNMVQPARFVGFDNFVRLFTQRGFQNALIVNLKYLALYVPLNMVIGFFVAILITKNTRWNKFVRTVSFAPSVTSMVAMSAVWLYIYHPQYGSLNSILNFFGFESVRWLNDPNVVLYSLIILSIWKKFGFCVLIYLGGLLEIPTEALEAADVDGATWGQKLRYVIIPLTSSTSYMLMILLVIESFQIFTQVDVMTQGGPAGASTTLLAHMYYSAFTEFQYGYGAAVSIVILLLTVGIYLALTRFEKYVSYES